jgi:hypothetical protein
MCSVKPLAQVLYTYNGHLKVGEPREFQFFVKLSFVGLFMGFYTA